MKTEHLPKPLSIAVLLFIFNIIQAQISTAGLSGTSLNGIQTAVPFLTIAPDARSARMGDVGVASRPDVNSQYWNAAKYAFVEGKGGIAFTLAPWNRNLMPGIYLASASAFYKISSKNIISSSFRYFSLGEIFLSSSSGTQSSYHPYEIAADAGYSRRFGDKLSGAIVFRYIHSDLTPGSTTPGGAENKPGTSIAGDLGVYYRNSFPLGEREGHWALGFNLSNVGTPITYSKDAEGTPIPTNLRMGGRFQFLINDHHSLSIQGDINKLLVPTPPVYDTDTASGDLFILRGKAPPESVIAGMLQSFYDAPGIQRDDHSYSVLREELYEIMYSVGLEYKYKKLLVFRTGYFHQHSTKGNRKYFTLGIGGKLHRFSLDLSYLIPSNGQNSPLANTFRLMIAVEFG